MDERPDPVIREILRKQERNREQATTWAARFDGEAIVDLNLTHGNIDDRLQVWRRSDGRLEAMRLDAHNEPLDGPEPVAELADAEWLLLNWCGVVVRDALAHPLDRLDDDEED